MGGSSSSDPPLREPPDNAADGISHVISDRFQADIPALSDKWDKEWIRYFFQHDDRNYFKNYRLHQYDLAFSPSEVAAFTADQVLTTRLNPDARESKLQIYVRGETLVGKDVFEMGCGVGMAGRVLGRLAISYVGYDYSPLALQIARLTSPDRCRYVHAGDTAAVEDLHDTADLCFGRHFFIHNNFDNSSWVLRFLRDVVRDDGIIHADFLRSEGASEGIFPAKSPLTDRTSNGFFYTRTEIEELADSTELEVDEMSEITNPPRVYVNFSRSTRRAL